MTDNIEINTPLQFNINATIIIENSYKRNGTQQRKKFPLCA